MLILSYAGLFVLSFLAATIPTELRGVAGYPGRYPEAPCCAPVLVATAGNVLGACATYWLGRQAARIVVSHREATRREVRAARLLRRYGGPTLLLSWIPILGDMLVTLAGATKLSFGAFLFWVTLGKGSRYALVAWAVSVL